LQVYRVALEKDGHPSKFPFPGLDIGRFLDGITGLLPTHKHKHKVATTTANSVPEAPTEAPKETPKETHKETHKEKHKEIHTKKTTTGSFIACFTHYRMQLKATSSYSHRRN
jgi:hypothetical protein